MTATATTYKIELTYTYELQTDDIERTMRLLIDPRFPDVDANLNSVQINRGTFYKPLDK